MTPPEKGRGSATRAAGTAALILAAGRSERFRSRTSKLLHPLAGRPLIDWVLGAVREFGAERIVLVVGHQAEEVKAACGDEVEFAYQTERKGTGHAVLMAAPMFEDFAGQVVILNGDLPMVRAASLRRLVDVHRAAGAALTLATAHVANPHGWGRIVRENGAVRAVVEEKDADDTVRAISEVNVGTYCIDPRVAFPMLERFTPANAQGEIYLTDLVREVIACGHRVAALAVDADEAAQVNSRGELAHMEKKLRERINAGWMGAGVTLADPDTTYIEPTVTIGRDTVIGPNVQLRGRTVVGENCRFDGSALLTDATIGDGVHVRFGVVIAEAEVGSDCLVGPFAQLRPGTRLADRVHIGDFVETKNAVLASGAKANHLAYLGDVEIGADTNIGAGTITCNYDGFRKHRTVIGRRVQIGSDTQLVAPVTVADDAYVATGTTVRRDVEAGALAFTVKEEVHRPGWVAAKRAQQAATAGKPAAKSVAVAKKPPRTSPAGAAKKSAKTGTRKARPARKGRR